MDTKLFRRMGWFCIPSSPLGAFIVILAAGFLVTVFVAIDRHSHSASDTLYAFFPYLICTFLLVDWIGRRSSDPAP